MLCFNVQRVHLSTEESPASWMVKLFGEVGGGIPEYFSSEKFFDKQCSMKLSPENSSKTLQLDFFYIPASNYIVQIQSYTEFLFIDMLIVLKSQDHMLPTFVHVKST